MALPNSHDPISSPRDVVRRLHEIMAASRSAQIKLNQVTAVIAEGLSSEVCSIYVQRDGRLELYATTGLAQSAVHVTQLAMGEGLVGTIAQTRAVLNLAEARQHPNFAYRPETGEELFHSFAGVPILRREQATGVVCVQHVDPREYGEEEIELLQTVAMVVSELIASAGVIDDATIASNRAQTSGSHRLAGLRLVEGLGRGIAVFHQPSIVIEHTVADDIETERKRVYDAFAAMRVQIDRMLTQAEFSSSGEHKDVLETYRMFAFDEGWSRRINAAIDSGLTAEAAIERVQQRTRAALMKTKDPLFRERLHDLEDLSNRLIRIVSGKSGTAADLELNQDIILIAKALGPAELLEYDRRWLKGVILEEGSPTAHVVIVSRAMGVPMLGRVRGLRETVAEGDPILIDTGSEAAFIRPSPTVVRQFEAHVALREKRQAEFAKLRDLPAVTTDGTRISLNINAGLIVDLPGLNLTNADGIGLFRTEFQFMVSAKLPRRQSQAHLYRQVLAVAGDRPVVFRSVDIGGDKSLPYMKGAEIEEENPAMGWRALRLALERRGLLKVQARALLEATAGKELRLMFPMVTEPWEFDAARAVVEEQRAAMIARNEATPQAVHYGAMVEVPALAFQLDVLLRAADFLSIGTNDLIQFLFAADRSHPKLADRYDWVSPSILRFLRRIIEAADTAGKPVTCCGEMGGRPLECLALLGIGLKRLSITPAAIGPIKAMVRATPLATLQASMAAWLAEPATDVRRRLQDFSTEHGIPL